MLRWLHRFLDRRYGVAKSYQPLNREEWNALLIDLADGYIKHEAVFRALQHLLHETERKAFDVPKLKAPADFQVWEREQYGVVREANIIRYALRLPLEGAMLKGRLAKKERAKEEAEKAEKSPRKPADLD